MSPRERRAALMLGRPYDRVPCDPLLGDHAARVLGISLAEYHRSAKAMAAAQLAAYHLYRHDLITIGPEWWGIAEAVGGEVCFPEYSAPFLRGALVSSRTQLDDLDLPDPRRAGRFPIFLEAISLLVEKIGAEVPIALTIGGPLSTAAALHGTESLLHALRADPYFAHRLIRFSLNATLPFVAQAALLGASLIMVDPIASGSLLSPTVYGEFAAPYQSALTRTAQTFGCSVTLHVCGDTHRLWEQMADTGATTLSLDSRVDLAAAKRAVGHRVTLAGNVKPRETMLLGTPRAVERCALECLKRGRGASAGYILGLGCGLPSSTPHENVHALINAARCHGRYVANDTPLAPSRNPRREIGA